MTQKDIIIEQAMNMFISHGIKAVRMDDIAQELSVSKRTLYELFGDKEELLYQSVMLFAKRRDELIMEQIKGVDNEIEIMMICMRNTLSMSPISQRLGYNMRRFYPVVYERVNKKSTEFLDLAVRNWLESSYKKGYITKSSNCDYVAQVLLNAMIGSVGSDMVDASDSQEYIAKITYAMLIFVRGLCTIEGIKIIDSLYDKYFSNISQTISLSND